MDARIAVSALALGALVCAGCDGGVQDPTPVAGALREPPPPPAAPPPIPTNPATDFITGDYALTLEVGRECGVLPDGDRTRRYGARIAPGAHGSYLATLEGGAFLSGPLCTEGSGRHRGLGCNQFFVDTDGEAVRLSLSVDDDGYHGGHLVERTATGNWMEIVGVLDGTVGPSRIEAAGPASVWYCPTASGVPFPCSGFQGCTASVRMTLDRR